MTIEEYLNQLSNSTIIECLEEIFYYYRNGCVSIQYVKRCKLIINNIIELTNNKKKIYTDHSKFCLFKTLITEEASKRFLKIYNYVSYGRE